jgi:hypothetical protein
MGGDILDLYSDYLLVSTRKTTATGLSELVEGAISHDKITRFLAGEELNGKLLWLKTKKLIRQYENGEGCLIFDDTIVEKELCAMLFEIFAFFQKVVDKRMVLRQDRRV